jgi:pimeloyl-ACP methyl ester carboxylesterase
VQASTVAVPLPTSDPPVRLRETAAGVVGVADEGPPDAPAVLCIHGIPGSARDFRYLGPLLATRLRVVRLEMPGFGSAPPGAVDTLAGWAAATVAAADALGFERFAVLGHSFGGGAALHAAARAGTRLTGAVLLASMGGRRHRGFLLPCGAYALGARLAGHRQFWRPATALVRAAYRLNGLRPPVDDAGLVLHMRLLGSVDFGELAASAGRVAAPALVVHAADDRLVEVDIARALVREFPSASFVGLARGGHHLNRTRPREVAEAVLGLLAPGS